MAYMLAVTLAACSSGDSSPDPIMTESSIYGTWDRTVFGWERSSGDPPPTAPIVLGLVEGGRDALVRVLDGQASVTMAERIEATSGQLVDRVAFDAQAERIVVSWLSSDGLPLASMVYELIGPNALSTSGTIYYTANSGRSWRAVYDRSPNDRL